MAAGLLVAVLARELVLQRRTRSALLASEAALRSEADRLAAVITTQQLVATTSSDLTGVMRLITDRVLTLAGATGVGIAFQDGYDVGVPGGERHGGVRGRAPDGAHQRASSGSACSAASR